jgi:hypothetical protein
MNIVISLASFVVFSLVSPNLSFTASCLLALGISVAAATVFAVNRTLDSLTVAGVGIFGVLTLASLGRPPTALVDYRDVVVTGALAAVVGLGLLVGRPFTETIARREAPRETWGSAAFKQVNRGITLAWFAAMVVLTASSAVAIATDMHVVFGWVVPIVAIQRAVVFTKAYPDKVYGNRVAVPAH